MTADDPWKCIKCGRVLTMQPREDPCCGGGAYRALVGSEPPPPLYSFTFGEACSTCDGAGDIFTNPTWNNDPQFETDHPCPACGGAGVDPGPQWPTR